MVINIKFLLSVIISSSAGQSGLSRQAATGSVFPVLGSVSYFSLCQCHRTSRNDPWDVLKKKKFLPASTSSPSDGTVIRVYRVKLPSFWASVSEKTVDCLRITLNQCSLLSKFQSVKGLEKLFFITCVASVSARVHRRKLEWEQKEEWRGRGEKRRKRLPANPIIKENCVRPQRQLLIRAVL